nr:hypothetical protein [Tanacetum cinerariifolium]
MMPVYGDGDLKTMKFIVTLAECSPSPMDTVSDICPNDHDISPLNPRSGVVAGVILLFIFGQSLLKQCSYNSLKAGPSSTYMRSPVPSYVLTLVGIRVLFGTSKLRIRAVNGSVSSHNQGCDISSSSADLCFFHLDFQCLVILIFREGGSLGMDWSPGVCPICFIPSSFDFSLMFTRTHDIALDVIFCFFSSFVGVSRRPACASVSSFTCMFASLRDLWPRRECISFFLSPSFWKTFMSLSLGEHRGADRDFLDLVVMFFIDFPKLIRGEVSRIAVWWLLTPLAHRVPDYGISWRLSLIFRLAHFLGEFLERSCVASHGWRQLVSTKIVQKDFRGMTCSQKWSQARLGLSWSQRYALHCRSMGQRAHYLLPLFGGLTVSFSSACNAPYSVWLSYGYPFIRKCSVTADGLRPLRSRFRLWSLDVRERIMILAGYDPGVLQADRICRELEKQRMRFSKDLDIQWMRLLMESQLQFQKLMKSDSGY